MKYPQRYLIKSVDLYTQLLWHLPQLYDKSGSHQSMKTTNVLPLSYSGICTLLPVVRVNTVGNIASVQQAVFQQDEICWGR